MAGNWRRLVAAFVLGAALFTTVPVWGQDLNTLLVNFLSDLRSGTFSIGTGKDIVISSNGDGAVTVTANGDGSDEALSVDLDDTANTATVSSSTGVATLHTPFTFVTLGGTTSSFPAWKRSTTTIQARLADDSAFASIRVLELDADSNINTTARYRLSSVTFVSATAPTISSGFGTSPSIVASNGTAAFTVNVGTGGSATSGVIGLPTAATGWRVTCDNTSTNTATVFKTKQTAFTTTTATIGNYDAAGAAAAWVASNVLVCSAMGF